MTRLTRVAIGLLLGVPSLAWTQPTDEVRYYHTDAIGSVRVITDATGTVVARHDYWPFGEEWQPPSVSNVRRFAGKERDVQTGFDYFGARYYASQNGRFTTVDPLLDVERALVDPQRWNRYAYGRSNPFRYVDPDGRALETPWDIFNAGLGLVSLVTNVAAGNVGGAVVDAGGLFADVAATLIPGVPGGAATSIRAARLAENARAGRVFETAVIDALGAVKSSGGVSEVASRVTTVPDLPIGKLFGVTEIKNVQNLSFSRQLQAQFAAAQTAGLPFNLIVSTRTRHVSETVREAIRSTKGRIFVYDERLRRFSAAAFDQFGNLIQ